MFCTKAKYIIQTLSLKRKIDELEKVGINNGNMIHLLQQQTDGLEKVQKEHEKRINVIMDDKIVQDVESSSSVTSLSEYCSFDETLR